MSSDMQMPTTREDYIAARDRLRKRYRAAVKRNDRPAMILLRESIETLNREIATLDEGF